MMRYQILYGKRGYPAVKWFSDEASTREFADKFRSVGYDVDVWLHTSTGAQKVDI